MSRAPVRPPEWWRTRISANRLRLAAIRAAGKSRSVWNASARLLPGSGAVYHQPSAVASTMVMPAPWPPVHRRCAQPQASRSCRSCVRRTPSVRATADLAPLASTRISATTTWWVVPSDSSARHRLSCHAMCTSRDPALSATPRVTAPSRSHWSKPARSKCHPGPSGWRRKSNSAGWSLPQTARFAWQAAWPCPFIASSKPSWAKSRRPAGCSNSPMRGAILDRWSTRTTDRAGASPRAVAQPAGPAPTIRTSHRTLFTGIAGGRRRNLRRVRVVLDLDGGREHAIRWTGSGLHHAKLGETLDHRVHARTEVATE